MTMAYDRASGYTYISIHDFISSHTSGTNVLETWMFVQSTHWPCGWSLGQRCWTSSVPLIQVKIHTLNINWLPALQRQLDIFLTVWFELPPFSVCRVQWGSDSQQHWRNCYHGERLWSLGFAQKLKSHVGHNTNPMLWGQLVPHSCCVGLCGSQVVHQWDSSPDHLSGDQNTRWSDGGQFCDWDIQQTDRQFVGTILHWRNDLHKWCPEWWRGGTVVHFLLWR